jgi:hypothetical protein
MKSIITLIIVVLACSALHAEAGVDRDRFVKKVKLSSELTAVVAEGDFEARSIGSFSVRLYTSENAQSGDATTFFVAGVIRERDGSIEEVQLADIDGDGKPELIVTVRNVGTGQYLSADAFAFDKKRVWLRATVTDLVKNADPVAALKKSKLEKK